MTEAKWKQLEERLGGRAAELLAGLSETERRQAGLATRALLRRPTGRPHTWPRLSEESALEAALQRLRVGQAGDEPSAQAFRRLVREGYQAERDERLGGFAAGLDRLARLEAAALACLAHRQGGVPAREAVSQALRVAYDRVHQPDPAARAEAGRTLAAVGQQVETSPALRQAVFAFLAAHLGDLDGLLRAC